jgi:hypothetical protein
MNGGVGRPDALGLVRNPRPTEPGRLGSSDATGGGGVHRPLPSQWQIYFLMT